MFLASKKEKSPISYNLIIVTDLFIVVPIGPFATCAHYLLSRMFLLLFFFSHREMSEFFSLSAGCVTSPNVWVAEL